MCAQIVQRSYPVKTKRYIKMDPTTIPKDVNTAAFKKLLCSQNQHFYLKMCSFCSCLRKSITPLFAHSPHISVRLETSAMCIQPLFFSCRATSLHPTHPYLILHLANTSGHQCQGVFPYSHLWDYLKLEHSNSSF